MENPFHMLAVPTIVLEWFGLNRRELSWAAFAGYDIKGRFVAN